MNARETAIEAACCYWRERGIDLEGLRVSARQTPLPGSLWWVEAVGPALRFDLLVTRLEKRSFHYHPHCPYGYTIYACRKTGETPLEVIEYEELARQRVEELCALRRYRGVALCYLANPSAAWRAALQESLASAQQCRETTHRRQVADRRLSRYPEQPRKWGGEQRSWKLSAPSHNDLMEGEEQAWRSAVFNLLIGAWASREIVNLSPTLHAVRAFLENRVQGPICPPFGCMWTPPRCLLLVPGDPGSQYELHCWKRWKWDHAYCLWFDGQRLRECMYEELESLLKTADAQVGDGGDWPIQEG
jgi:hypothetical protein